MNIKQFRYGQDNLGYVLWTQNEGVVIDGGAVEEMLSFCEKKNIMIRYILNTHVHWDHVSGNKQLEEKTKAPILAYEMLLKEKQIRLANERIEILFTPGHTMDSICYYVSSLLVTGDTLFNGTIGNCFSKKSDVHAESIFRLMGLPMETMIYAGHDYYMAAVAKIQKVDPENENLPSYIGKYDEQNVYSTLQMELEVNPYLRFDDPFYQEILIQRKYPHKTRLERFKSVYQNIG